MKAKSEQDRGAWEQTRTLAFYTVVAQQGTKQIRLPKDLFPLPWDEDTKVKGKRMTKEEFHKLANQIINKN